MAHAEDPVIPDKLDDVLASVIGWAGWYIPDTGWPSPVIAAFFERNHKGLCALCESTLEENTLLVMDSTGLAIGFCSSPCMQDFHVMQWMMNEYDRLEQMVRMRNAQGEETDGEEAAGVEEDPREEGSTGEGEGGEAGEDGQGDSA